MIGSVGHYRRRIPAPASANGLKLRTFGPSLTVGTNWFPATGTTYVVNADGSVTITGGPNSFNWELATALPGSNGAFTGRAWGGGGYFEAALSWTGTYTQTGGWPSFWSVDVEKQSANPNVHWIGQATGYDNWIEADFMEYWSQTTYGSAMHNWYGTLPSPPTIDTNMTQFTVPTGTIVSQPHRYGFLWVPATSTTQGHVATYFDGVKNPGTDVFWNQYNPNLAPPPVAGTSAWSVMDVRHLMMILGCGPTNPMTVYSVEVWQSTTANNQSF